MHRLPDALDLDDAIRGLASRLGDLGCAESLDVRRSLAAGELARRQLALDLTTQTGSVVEEGALAPVSKPPHPRRRRPVRKTVLHLHLSEAAIRGDSDGQVGRVENTRSPVTADTIRAWCGHPDTHLVVKPVIDLADHVNVEAYEVPDRIAERLAVRDHTCVFPWCTRPARSLRPDEHRCDADHTTPWRDDGTGGATCTCQLAPLCRTHHRLKTFGGWTYTALDPGSYLWTTPHGYHYLRDHTGTRDVTPDRRAGHRH